MKLLALLTLAVSFLIFIAASAVAYDYGMTIVAVGLFIFSIILVFATNSAIEDFSTEY